MDVSRHLSDADPKAALPPRAGIAAVTATVTGAGPLRVFKLR